jgi:dCMP deaminase
MIWKHMQREDYLDMAYLYATKMSGCCKVAVGAVIVKDDQMIAFGANRAMPSICQTRGCLRVEKYGNDSKSHRNPEDCRAIHSEICALSSLRESPIGATIYVTRYPCEGCAKAIAAAGIKEVVYGGTTQISHMTQDLFDDFNIKCIWLPDWKEDLSDR